MTDSPGATTDLAAERADLDRRRAELAAERAEFDAAKIARQAEDAIMPHVDAGRLLPRQKEEAVALMGSLLQSDATFSFAAPDGESGQVTKTAAETFEGLLGGLPTHVHYQQLAGGGMPDGGDDEQDHAGVAKEARSLMAEARERGETLSPDAAVDRVRAKRGR